MFLIHSKKGCSSCARTRRLLSQLGYKYRTRYPNADELHHLTGRATYPQVFDGRKFVGGFEDLQRYLGLVIVPGSTWKPPCSARGCS